MTITSVFLRIYLLNVAGHLFNKLTLFLSLLNSKNNNGTWNYCVSEKGLPIG